MSEITVDAAEFQKQAAKYVEQSGKGPVFVTEGGRATRVLLDINDYERLTAGDSQGAFSGQELPEEAMIALDESSNRDS